MTVEDKPSLVWGKIYPASLTRRTHACTLADMNSRIHSFALCIAAVVAMTSLMSTPATAEEAGVYRHAVFFKFKDSATPEQIKAIEDGFRALPSKIDVVTGFEWGTNVSPENLNDGFTHCFFVTFKDKSGIETYIPHPAHKAFVEMLKPQLDKVFVLDYVAKK